VLHLFEELTHVFFLLLHSFVLTNSPIHSSMTVNVFFLVFLTQVNHFINSLRNKQLGQRPEAQNNHFVKVRNRKKQHFRRSQEQKKEGLVKSSESRSPETPRDQGVVARAKERRAAPMPVNV
jgi:hypothetical protein